MRSQDGTLFLVMWQTAVAGPPEKPGNPGLPGCLAKVSELNDIVANQQETIEQQAARIEELEDMLQNFAPVPQTGQTQSFGEGDDGELQMGVQWPDPRFTDNDDGMVTDNLTKLIWLKDADCFGIKNWDDALAASNDLANGVCELSDGSVSGDWRLPNIRELYSLIDTRNWDPSLPTGHPFQNVCASLYWSSTTDAYNTASACVLHMPLGFVGTNYDKGERICVWPVRGGKL